MSVASARWVVLLFVLVFSAYGASDPERAFQEGISLYQEGRYEESLRAFERILESGYEAGPVYYNLGNCHFKRGEMGRAILYYERAARLLPGNADVQFNLGLVNQTIVDQFEVEDDFFLIRLWRGLLDLFPKPLLLAIIGSFYLLTILFVIASILTSRRGVRLVSRRLAVLGGILFVTAGLLFLARHLDEKGRIEAVILADRTDVMSAPTGTEVFVLHEGTKVRIDRRQGEWVEIILPDRKVGWVKAEVLDVI